MIDTVDCKIDMPFLFSTLTYAMVKTNSCTPLLRWFFVFLPLSASMCQIRLSSYSCLGGYCEVFSGVIMIMVNNPLSRALILAALSIASPWKTLLGSLGLLSSTIMAMLIGQER